VALSSHSPGQPCLAFGLSSGSMPHWCHVFLHSTSPPYLGFQLLPTNSILYPSCLSPPGNCSTLGCRHTRVHMGKLSLPSRQPRTASTGCWSRVKGTPLACMHAPAQLLVELWSALGLVLPPSLAMSAGFSPPLNQQPFRHDACSEVAQFLITFT